ncbi:hypothetical protein J5N97_017806 [Dioscorea zingiberensis]|uniref:Uncharacterized protein n=1 Tax=Dioscorea zingiberensis TaxID=325984 RepID=A0A9D5HGJ9_9LILI|nr:hypothetical protein J5N97_017806 [Dioscorea zingiberensis]
MVISKKSKPKPRSRVLPLVISSIAIAFFWLFYASSITNSRLSCSSPVAVNQVGSGRRERERLDGLERKHLYWGSRVDCPGKHCNSCEGLGHQESNLRCALEEALFLKRMCVNPMHNKKGILHRSRNTTSEERCTSSLY